MRTIHVLRHGFSLCRFSEVVPGLWPVGNVWVSVSEFITGGYDDTKQLCQACRSEVRKLVEVG